MKRMKIIFSAAMLLMASVVFGQKEVTVPTMATGVSLSEESIGFLSLVSAASVDASRGAATKEATVAGTTYKAGHVLTASEAKALNKAIKAFQKTYKAPDASRGAGLCYYWYYYCDGWGYCYWYKYWYYC